jgi:hypothetical protein
MECRVLRIILKVCGEPLLIHAVLGLKEMKSSWLREALSELDSSVDKLTFIGTPRDDLVDGRVVPRRRSSVNKPMLRIRAKGIFGSTEVNTSLLLRYVLLTGRSHRWIIQTIGRFSKPSTASGPLASGVFLAILIQP